MKLLKVIPNSQLIYYFKRNAMKQMDTLLTDLVKLQSKGTKGTNTQEEKTKLAKKKFQKAAGNQIGLRGMPVTPR